jgi:hypothetical protein
MCWNPWIPPGNCSNRDTSDEASERARPRRNFPRIKDAIPIIGNLPISIFYEAKVVGELEQYKTLGSIFWKCHSVEIRARWTEFLKVVASIAANNAVGRIISAILSLKILHDIWHHSRNIIEFMIIHIGNTEFRAIIAVSIDGCLSLIDYVRDWFRGAFGDEWSSMDFGPFVDVLASLANMIDDKAIEKILKV